MSALLLDSFNLFTLLINMVTGKKLYLHSRKGMLAGVGKPVVFIHEAANPFTNEKLSTNSSLPATSENRAYQHENDDFNGPLLMLFPRLFHTVFSLFLPSVSK
jgi:hypothetical protein